MGEFTSYEPSYADAYDDAYRTVFDIPGHLTSNSNARMGGSAIASGGYGCVFRPPIKCKGETKLREGNISKLMRKKKAEDEMREVKDAERILKSIPDYEKYFALTGYHICVPATLTAEDEKSFNVKCQGPLRATFSKVNNSLSSYRAIVSPDLGTDLSKAIKDMFNAQNTASSRATLLANLANLNETSADLLENGIAKMAPLEFYHADVKPQNIMTNYDDSSKQSFTEMKLIDFGLALPYGAESRDVNTYIMFNAPFSAFLFSRDVVAKVDGMLRQSSNFSGNEYGKFMATEISKLVDDEVFKNSGRTHIPYMIELGARAYGITESDYRRVLRGFYAAYCEQVILAFTRLGDKGVPYFDIEKYWDKVYRFNLDIWGFLTTFLMLMSYSRAAYPGISAKYGDIVNAYLYNVNYAAYVIPVKDVADSLRRIADEFRRELQPKIVAIPSKQIPGPKRATKKRRLVIVKEFPKKANKSATGAQASSVALASRKKRCPKGYVRHKKDPRRCVKKGSNREVRTTSMAKSGSTTVDIKVVGITLKGKRCPKGFKRHRTLKTRCIGVRV